MVVALLIHTVTINTKKIIIPYQLCLMKEPLILKCSHSTINTLSWQMLSYTLLLSCSFLFENSYPIPSLTLLSLSYGLMLLLTHICCILFVPNEVDKFTTQCTKLVQFPIIIIGLMYIQLCGMFSQYLWKFLRMSQRFRCLCLLDNLMAKAFIIWQLYLGCFSVHTGLPLKHFLYMCCVSCYCIQKICWR